MELREGIEELLDRVIKDRTCGREVKRREMTGMQDGSCCCDAEHEQKMLNSLYKHMFIVVCFRHVHGRPCSCA
jgi:hypothetical protein